MLHTWPIRCHLPNGSAVQCDVASVEDWTEVVAPRAYRKCEYSHNIGRNFSFQEQQVRIGQHVKDNAADLYK